jgi:hypothetical protein
MREISPEYDLLVEEMVESLKNIAGGSWGPVDVYCTEEIEKLLTKLEVFKAKGEKE